MHTENTIIIAAGANRVYELGARIEYWPEILPHYRWVTILRDDGRRRLAEMAATRDGIPIKWVSIQELDPDRRVIRYRHVRGITRGMIVEWTIEPAQGGVMVRISHDFDPPWPRPLGPLVARYVVGDMFVHNVANKTLRRIKSLAEGSVAAAPVREAATVPDPGIMGGR